jgi:hypothetical protein
MVSSLGGFRTPARTGTPCRGGAGVRNASPCCRSWAHPGAQYFWLARELGREFYRVGYRLARLCSLYGRAPVRGNVPYHDGDRDQQSGETQGHRGQRGSLRRLGWVASQAPASRLATMRRPKISDRKIEPPLDLSVRLLGGANHAWLCDPSDRTAILPHRPSSRRRSPRRHRPDECRNERHCGGEEARWHCATKSGRTP